MEDRRLGLVGPHRTLALSATPREPGLAGLKETPTSSSGRPEHSELDPETPAARLRFATLVTALFVAATVPRLLLHELWRDEAWQWLVALESRSLPQLFADVKRGGGIGYVFPVLTYGAKQISTSPLALQALHGILAAAAAFVFCAWAPLARRDRALFVLGYFPFYEYAVISRSYAVGALLLWLACAATRARRPAWKVGLALAALCQTTIYGYLLAIAVACGALLDRFLHRDRLAPLLPTAAAAGAAVALLGFIAGPLEFAPAPGTSVLPWYLTPDLGRLRGTLLTVWRAFVPVPKPGLHFWNTGALAGVGSLEVWAGALILVLAIALLARSRVAWITFATGAAALLLFAYAYLPSAARHHGHLWLLFGAALWLGRGVGLRETPASWRALTLTVLLAVHAAAGVYASAMDILHPFSNGAATAALLRRNGLDRAPLLGHREPPAATVALYLGQALYSPSRKAYVTHPDWGPLQREMSDAELRCAARELALQERQDVVLVINRELPPWPEIESAGATRGAINATEDYTLYWLRLARLPSTTPEARCPAEGAAANSLDSRP